MMMNTSNGTRGALAWSLALIGAGILTARGQDELAGIGTESAPELATASTDWNDWPSRATIGIQQRSDTDVDNGTSFSVSSLKLGLGAEHKFNDAWRGDLQGSYSFLMYDFTDTAQSGGKPWDNINVINGRALARAQVDEQWVAIGGPLIAYSAESDAGESAATIGIGLGGVYTIDADLKVGLLLAVMSQIEDSAGLVPIPLVMWKFADQWILRTGAAEVAASSGVGADVEYAYMPELSFALGAQMQKRRFRLDDAGLAPDGVGEDKTMLLYAQSTWQALADLEVQVMAGFNGGGTLRVEDENGNTISGEDFDTALTIGARVKLTY